jgi:hypothetical protein
MSNNNQTDFNQASPPDNTVMQSNVVWEASPSKWLLASRLAITFFLLLASIVSAYSYHGEKMPYSSGAFLELQIFLAQNLPVNYVIWAATAFVFFTTAFMYIRLLCETYTITKEKLDYRTGVFNRDVDETKLFRVVDISVEIPFLLRLIGRGHIILFSNDPSLESSGIKRSFQTPDGRKGVYLTAIKNPMEVKEIIAEQVELQRTKYTTRSTEML